MNVFKIVLINDKKKVYILTNSNRDSEVCNVFLLMQFESILIQQLIQNLLTIRINIYFVRLMILRFHIFC